MIPSAQVFNIGNNYYMVDCGETASFWLSRFNINVCRLRKVFITHMHADHYLGLPGIIYLMDLMGAKHLQVYGPVGLKEAIDLCLNCTVTSFVWIGVDRLLTVYQKLSARMIG